MSILSLKDVSYQSTKTSEYILSNININFETGKLYCIVGKSDIEKTTLFSLISGIEDCTKGMIFYSEQNIYKLNKNKYRANDIGIVFQNYNLIKNATAVDNIIISMNVCNQKRKNKKENAYILLEKVGINIKTANYKVMKLSKNEQQRVAIARAICNNQNIIIVDELIHKLDSEADLSIMEIFLELTKKQKKCVIIMTHCNKVIAYADEVWGITNGKLLFLE